LRACLPDRLWSAFEQHSARSPRGIAFTTERLQDLAFLSDQDHEADAITHSHPISRSGLRQLLLTGLEDVVHFDTRVVGFDRPSPDDVQVHLADGSRVSCNVLVGADGSTSAIRKHLLPDARVVDTGVIGIAGKVFLDAGSARRDWIGEKLLDQMTMVVPVREAGMFIAPFLRPDASTDMPTHLFWVLLARAESLGLRPGAHAYDGNDLQGRARVRVEHWHPLLRNLVDAADPSTIVGIPLHTSIPVPRWQTSRVTLLGDAIHTMTPLQGLGGNTALVDAAILGHNLVEASMTGGDVVAAIGAYETVMHEYAFDAVQRSLQVSSGLTSTNVFGRLAFRTVLRAANRLPWLHTRLFASRDIAAERLAPATSHDRRFDRVQVLAERERGRLGG
jgi:salicylate hydroxylase